MSNGSDPSYVRLRSSLTVGMKADMEVGGSGWSIAGFDVKPFPTEAKAVNYVRAELRAGRLEPAGKAEYDEAHPEGEDIPPADTDVPHQESAVQEAAEKQRQALQEARNDSGDSSETEGDEPKAKKSTGKGKAKK